MRKRRPSEVRRRRAVTSCSPRRLLGEFLEPRWLLTSDFQNPVLPMDVDHTGFVSLTDLLAVVSHLREHGNPHLLDEPPEPGQTPPFVDVNGDVVVSVSDLFEVVTDLRAGAGQPVPELEAGLANDTGPGGQTNDDGLTFDAAIAVVSDVASREGGRLLGRLNDGPFFQVSLSAEGEFLFDPGLPRSGAADGEYQFRLFAQNFGGPVASTLVTFTYDRTLPAVVAAPQGLFKTAFTSLEVAFNKPLDDSAFVAEAFTLEQTSGVSAGGTVAIASLERLGPARARLHLDEPLPSAAFQLAVAPTIHDLAGNSPLLRQTFAFTVADVTGITEISPAHGEEMVNVVRETIVRFDRPVDPATVDEDAFHLIAHGERVSGRIVVSSTERFATFFYDEPLPSSTAIRIVVDGDRIQGRDGKALDADGDLEPGGKATADFRTLPLTRIPGTNLFGFVRDSYTGEPLVGATIRVDAFPEANAVTADDGRFDLIDMPAPEFFVHIDGSTATHRNVDGVLIPIEAGVAYPNVGKPFHSVPGQTVQLNKMGMTFDVFLPPMSLGDVQTLSSTEDTNVSFGAGGMEALAAMFPDMDPTVFSRMRVTFAPGAAVDEQGNTATQAIVIPVPPDRIPAPLPAAMDTPLVVSIQAMGATNFDVPAPITFPNLSGLAPGEKILIQSFNHDAGRWDVTGTATVSDDGLAIVSDPGVGLVAPGWHAPAPGTPTDGDVGDCKVRFFAPECRADINDIRVTVSHVPGETIVNESILSFRQPLDFVVIPKARGFDFRETFATFGESLNEFTIAFDTTVPDEFVEWRIDSLNEGTGLLFTQENPTPRFFIEGFGKMATFKVIDNVRPLTGTIQKNDAVAFSIFVRATQPDTLSSTTRRVDLRQGEKGVLRQEYVDFGFAPPAVTQDDVFSKTGNYRPLIVDNGVREIFNAVKAEFDSPTALLNETTNVGSAFRNPRRNVNVGGSPNSNHMSGSAVDLSAPGGTTQNKERLYRAALAAVSGPDAEVLLEDTVGGQELGSNILFPRNWVPPEANHTFCVNGTGTECTGGVQIIVADDETDSDTLPDHVETLSPPNTVLSSETRFSKDAVVFAVRDENGNGVIDVGEPLEAQMFRGSNQGVFFPLRRFFEVASHTHAARTVRLPELSTLLPSSDSDGLGSGESEIERRFSTEPGFGTNPVVHYRFVLSNGAELSGRIGVGQPVNEVLPPQTNFTLYVYQPATNRVHVMAGKTAVSGQPTRLGELLLDEVGGLDSDGDGLPDYAEKALGTNAFLSDSDGDGILDSAAVAQGLDPLGGRSFPTGVIASVALRGEAREVVVQGSLLDGERQTAYVATGSYGLAVIDVSQFNVPLVRGQIELPGVASDVAVDTRLRLAAVAASESGIHVVDVSDPQAPVLQRTLNVPASQIELFDGLAYVAHNAELRAYDLVTGELVSSTSLPGEGAASLTREGDQFYVFRNQSRTLALVDASLPTPEVIGQLDAIPISDVVRLVASSDLVVLGGAGAGTPNGLATVDVSNPAAPTLISPPAANFDARGLALNGSGLALVGSEVLGRGVGLYDLTDPQNTNAFLLQFAAAGRADAIAIASGVAYVAARSAGLHVLNYLPFDDRGAPPSISISAPDRDDDPNTPGVQILEGATLPIFVQTEDDVQVRNVELLIEGQVVANSVSFPFDFRAVAANPEPGATSLTIQARAFDTGGNVAFSNAIVLELLPDNVAPKVSAVLPAEGAVAPPDGFSVIIRFDEPMRRSSLNPNNIVLRDSAGNEAAPVDIRTREDDRVVRLAYTSAPIEHYEVVLNAAEVTDRAGNALGNGEVVLRRFIVSEAPTTIAWTSNDTGDWNDPTNWDLGRVPGPNDAVVIDVAEDVTVTYSTGETRIRSLTSANAFTLSGGTLHVSETIEVSNVFHLAGGTLKGATILPGANGELVIVTATVFDGAVVLDSVIVEAELDATVNLAHVRVLGDLVVGGTVRLDRGAQIAFDAGQGDRALVGDGEIVISDSTSTGGSVSRIVGPADATLTLGPDLTLRGGHGHVHGLRILAHANIVADSPGRTLIVSDLIGLTGNVAMGAGANLQLDGSYTLAQDLAVPAGSLLSLGGAGGAGVVIDGALSVTDAELTFRGPWENRGTIDAVDSIVRLGSFTPETLGVLNRTGGEVRVTGFLNLQGGDFTLNAATGDWILDRGQIRNGTIKSEDGARLLVTGWASFLNQENWLLGVTVNADVVLTGARAQLFAVGPQFTLNGTITIGDPNNFGFEHDVRFATGTSSTGEILLDGTGEIRTHAMLRDFFDTAGISIRTGETLIVGPEITVRGDGEIGVGSNVTLINQGTIIADAPVARRLDVAPFRFTGPSPRFQNEGTLRIENDAEMKISPMSGNLNNVEIVGAQSRLEVHQGSNTTYTVNEDITVPPGAELNLNDGWTNQATIIGNDATLVLGAFVAWTNQGAIIANGGELTLAGAFSNPGTITATDATVNLGGQFTLDALNLPNVTHTGAAINLTGVLDNTEQAATFNTVTGTWNLRGGTIRGGTIAFSEGQSLQLTGDGGVLDGVTLNSDLNSAGAVTLRNGATLNGSISGASIRLSEGQTINGPGQIILAGGIHGFDDQGDGDVILEANLTIRGHGEIRDLSAFQPSLINRGVISADVDGQALEFDNVQFGSDRVKLTNEGLLRAENGGIMRVERFIGNSGSFETAIGSRIQVTAGDLPLAANGHVGVELGGVQAGEFGQITVSGETIFGGTLNIELADGYSPSIGDEFPIITYGSHSGTFAEVNGTDLGGGKVLQLDFRDNALVLVTAAALQAVTIGDGTGEALLADESLLAPLAGEAVRRWSVAGAEVMHLHNIELRLADLSGDLLALAASGVIWIDRDAAGHGWFVDPTPDQDEEFSPPAVDRVFEALGESPASGRIDLLTTLLHEIGHLLGQEHADEIDDLLSERLATGVRKTPS